MSRANKAIIMAAGKGERMRPVTLKCPKPLVSVNGKEMIRSVIDALAENGIEEIVIVTGYLKEQFHSLKEIYSNLNIILLENPWYETCNNISSLYTAREYLGDCIILDGDQLIETPQILSPLFEISGYCCRWTSEDTEEWLLTQEQGRVVSCNRNGGKNGWQLYSVSFWNQEDGQKLRRHLELEFVEKKHTQMYWDDIAIFCYPQEYNLGIREVKEGDIIEIDQLSELAAIDSRYQQWVEKKG